MQLLLPGDLLPLPSPSTSTSIHLGPGLSSSTTSGSITSTRAGILGSISSTNKNDKQRHWLESTLKRYTPSPPEPILGIIVARHAEGYRVDIGSSQSASLDALAFEGATKRNKPNLKIGTIVYGYLLPTPPFSEPELSCVDQTTQKSQGFGELQDGFLIRSIELSRCRQLLSEKNGVLARLGSKFPFEVAVGMNGRVWVKGQSSVAQGEGEEGELEEMEKMVEIIREIKG
ncbi:hypothetical protein JCM5353_007358 [Sporobolomyces roseus]